MWPQVSALKKRVGELMTGASAAGNDHAGRAAALEEYLQLARVHQDDEQLPHRRSLRSGTGDTEIPQRR